MAQCSIFVGQMARCNIVVGQMAQCSIFMGQMAQCSIVVGQMAQCSIVVGQMAQCSIFMAQMAQCSIVVGQMAQCSIIVGQMAQCSIVVGQMAQCSIFMAQMAQCSIFMDQEIFARMTSTTKACFNVFLHLGSASNIVERTEATYRSKIQIPNSGEVTLWLSMHFFPHPPSARSPFFRGHLANANGGTHQGTPSDFKTGGHQASRPNIRFCIFSSLGSSSCPAHTADLPGKHTDVYEIRINGLRNCPARSAALLEGPRPAPQAAPVTFMAFQPKPEKVRGSPSTTPCLLPTPVPVRAHTDTHTVTHLCGDLVSCVGRLMMVGVDARISRADLLLENVLVYPSISLTHSPQIVSDARQLLSLLIVKGQTEQTTWVTYITQRGPTFLVREARFGYTVPVITQPLAQFLARQGLLINAVFATAGVRDAFMTLVGVISVDPTGVAAKQLPLPFGARAWPTGGSSRNPRTDVPIFCNGVQVRHDICPVVWTMPHPSWCPCQWADTEKELYLGSLLVKSFIISPRAVYTVGTRFPPLLDYLRSRQPQIHVPEECLLHGPPARPERHSYHPAGVAPRRSGPDGGHRFPVQPRDPPLEPTIPGKTAHPSCPIPRTWKETRTNRPPNNPG
ncbi:hypothetical protein PAPYR_13202 [Paratrimastix pyriformis]|uniref:Uncharacterized protein n=1 Tax=Paratrimastix pyriformis TaxID=342808 RepID=A0ABQ8U0L5_9EUKA|nr:hypothetical protein PAPYR_13202 [Paratrimastix pyriformis]